MLNECTGFNHTPHQLMPGRWIPSWLGSSLALAGFPTAFSKAAPVARTFRPKKRTPPFKMTSSSSQTPNALTEPSAVVINKTAHDFSKIDFDSLLSRRFFFAPAFEIYGGEARGSVRGGGRD